MDKWIDHNHSKDAKDSPRRPKATDRPLTDEEEADQKNKWTLGRYDKDPKDSPRRPMATDRPLTDEEEADQKNEWTFGRYAEQIGHSNHDYSDHLNSGQRSNGSVSAGFPPRPITGRNPPPWPMRGWYETFVEDTQRDRREDWNGNQLEQQTLRPYAEIFNEMVTSFTKKIIPHNQNRSNDIFSGIDAREEALERGPPGLKPISNFFDGMAESMRGENRRLSRGFDEIWGTTWPPLTPVWGPPSNRFGIKPTEKEDGKVGQMIENTRKATAKTPATYTWSGQLPRKSRSKAPIYSCKVFLGGIPYDLTDSDLHVTFAQFGHISIQWPGKDIKSAIDGAAANKAGYVYLIFESYDNVAALLNHCILTYRDMESGPRWYFSISSRRQKGKEVQVIPFDIGDRFYMKSSFSGHMEHSRTVFVGALHGMLSADGLAKVLDDLFGGVVFAGLDTDKYKYPLGSGRVSFDNVDSYLKAVSAAFVEIKSARFKKKIQIDPYIENESMCCRCHVQQSAPIFCRDDFMYFCGRCWELYHGSDPDKMKHRPIIKNKANA